MAQVEVAGGMNVRRIVFVTAELAFVALLLILAFRRAGV